MTAGLRILEQRLTRGLDPATFDVRHDDTFCDLLRQYEALVQEQTGTCLRRDHVGAQLDADQEAQGRWVEQRIGGIR